ARCPRACGRSSPRVHGSAYEAEHCDRLLLMRDGHLLAQLSPDELRERTDEQNLETAFLTLITMGERA
ncbi:hypothetical protein ACWDNR_24995, partial [Gordonia aichiensis]